jgi:hypothetical protein
MSRSASARRARPEAQTFVGCLRKFLTPEAFKQGHQANCRRRRQGRWEVQPLVLVLLGMTWCLGDSLPERFETARAFTITLTAKRRRPGKTASGFARAVARLPMPVLRAVAACVRRRLLALFAPVLRTDGWLPFGCDGSRLECPRSAELERRLDPAGKPDSAPTLWLTALVHLRTGLLWAWRLGLGTASERAHLQKLLVSLPAAALVVCDAGYTGFGLAASLVEAQVSFLIRLSSTVEVYAASGVLPRRWRDGEVYYWPKGQQGQGRPPLRLRLIRVCSRSRKTDVWLLTNVPDGGRLSVAAAGRFYRMRWESEGFFRTYKRTLGKLRLVSRTVRLVHREAEGSLLAAQLLLAQGTWGLLAVGRARCAASSPRLVLRLIRQEIHAALSGRARSGYLKRLSKAERERRRRSSAKEKRPWPRRKPHKQPGAPNILTLSDELKALLEQVLRAA